MMVGELQNFSGINIQIISFQYPFAEKTYTWKGFTVHALGGNNKKGTARLNTWRKAYRLLKEIRQRQGIDTIFSCWATECAFIGGHFAKRNAVNHLCWIIGQDSKPGNRYVKYISRNTVFACKTPFIRDYFEKNHGIRPQYIIPNGLNKENLPKIEIENKTFDLIGAGSLIELKRYDWLINIVKDLSSSGFRLNCLLVGDGPEKAKLEKMIGDLDLNSFITLTGNLDHAATIQQMGKSKILIHPSSFEGFSTVTLEALYAGCHVITTCRPFEEENEQMHYVNSYEGLLNKTKELLSKNLIHRSQLQYTTKKSAEILAKIIREG